MNIDDLNENEIEGMEAERRAKKNDVRETEQHHGSVENLSNTEIESMEAEIKARRDGYNSKETVEHYGSVENLSDDEIEGVEAEIRARRNDVRETEQHHGSIENADESTLSAMAANKATREEEHRPSKEYLMSLIDNPDIQNYDEFTSAVSGSMQLNKIMVDFTDRLCEKISSKTFELRNTDKNDRGNVEKIKQEIEKLVSVYERYMYELKDNRWDFNNLTSMKIPEMVTEQLRQEQKRLDIQFDMPIPADLGEYYGGKFERDGKMFPGIDLMYEELGGKEQNWHSVLNYKPDELTPAQRYRQRKLEEIRAKQEVYDAKKTELGQLQRESQQRGTSYGE